LQLKKIKVLKPKLPARILQQGLQKWLIVTLGPTVGTEFAGSDQWGSIPFSLITRGLKWRFTVIVSHFPRLIVSATPIFSLLATKKFNNDFKRREYHVDCHVKKAASFFVACKPNQPQG
jgi:hypothetical protein